MSSMVFSGADDLWKAVMKNISTKINQSGGAASENKEVSKRVSYSNDVSSEDKTKIRNGGN